MFNQLAASEKANHVAEGAVVNFHTRVANLPWVAATKAHDNTPVLAVNNQLLVDAAHAPSVVAALNGPFSVQAHLLTTLLDGLHPLDKVKVSDVHIYELTPQKGSRFAPQSRGPAARNIFWLADSLRHTVSSNPQDGAVISPNHIVIPAPLADSCPHGPPTPIPGLQPFAAPTGALEPVTVIDAGWQWDDARWGTNPLPASVRAVEAQRLPTLSEAGHLGPHWLKGSPETPGEHVQVNGKPRLLALAGHSNFIAGMIAQYAPGAQISVVSLNGSFLEAVNRPTLSAQPALDPNCYDFPSEASVARAMAWCFSQNATTLGLQLPKVVNLGFAFLPWTQGLNEPTFQPGTDQVSSVWWRAFEYVNYALELRGLGPNDVMFAAPTGNQASRLRRYPAALWTKSPLFANVLGVASIDAAEPTGVATPSDFTNLGDSANGDAWVRCAAVGSNVVSTFLRVKSALEDDPNYNVEDFTHNAWAMWNGTSFATPKVVAWIANALAGAPDAATAWQNFSQTGVQPNAPGGNPDLGIEFV